MTTKLFTPTTQVTKRIDNTTVIERDPHGRDPETKTIKFLQNSSFQKFK